MNRSAGVRGRPVKEQAAGLCEQAQHCGGDRSVQLSGLELRYRSARGRGGVRWMR